MLGEGRALDVGVLGVEVGEVREDTYCGLGDEDAC